MLHIFLVCQFYARLILLIYYYLQYVSVAQDASIGGTVLVEWIESELEYRSGYAYSLAVLSFLHTNMFVSDAETFATAILLMQGCCHTSPGVWWHPAGARFSPSLCTIFWKTSENKRIRDLHKGAPWQSDIEGTPKLRQKARAHINENISGIFISSWIGLKLLCACKRSRWYWWFPGGVENSVCGGQLPSDAGVTAATRGKHDDLPSSQAVIQEARFVSLWHL